MFVNGSSYSGSVGPDPISTRRLVARFGGPQPRRGGAPAPALGGFVRRFLDLRGVLGNLRTAARTRTHFAGGGPAEAVPLGLDASRTPTTLRSQGEINATTTGHEGGPKSFSGASTASVLVGGSYDGSQGTDTLTFVVKLGGEVGQDKLQLDVLDGSGRKLEALNFNKKYEPGSPVTLRNGLTVSLDAGVAAKGDSFQVQVVDASRQAVDPTAAFDSLPGPNFEGGVVVRAGSFELNGATIDVRADDSIVSVLDRINRADVGVIARYDAAAEEVVLTADARGPEGTIRLGNDSSGFLAATKLEGAPVVPGRTSDLDRVISSVPALAGIVSGDFVVNGEVLRVDTAVDTLQDVLDRINASERAGVVAYYDSNEDAVVVRPVEPGGPVALEDGKSGLVSALGLGPRDAAAPTSAGLSFVDPSRVRASLQGLGRSIQGLLDGSLTGGSATQAGLAAHDLRAAVASVFERQFDADPTGERFRSGLGIDFIFDDPRGEVVQIDVDRLVDTLRRDPEALAELFFATGSGREEGLLTALEGAFATIADRLAAYVDPDVAGLLLDLRA